MTSCGDTQKPIDLLQMERLIQKGVVQETLADLRPALRSLISFAQSPGSPKLSLASLKESDFELSSSTKTASLSSLGAVEILLPRSKPTAPHLSIFAPTLSSLLLRIRETLENSSTRLLELNPSRRDSICQYLEALAGSAPSSTPAGRKAPTSAEKLRVWADWRNLSKPHQEAATLFFEEVGLLALAQAILLKAWSDRGLRKLKREDLGDLNAALHGALRPLVPMDRDGWQVTKPNLFSWFKLPADIQDSLWSEFSAWRIIDEGPELLTGLIQSCRQIHAERAQPVGFEESIYSAIWKNTPESQRSPGATPRKSSAFSPTLRDASLVRCGPNQLLWYGWESNAFSLFMGELSLLWWGPSCPPYWGLGTGLESSLTTQLSLNIPLSDKKMVTNRIHEMESCDLAWVLEERVIRGCQRSPEAQRVRELADANPSLKRLRTGGTSLGHLQACVAISKLRPGGFMWWIRQEPLHASDGSEALQFLLDRGKLISEWDFSGVNLSLQQSDEKQTLPRYIYLFQRETDVQLKLEHHPLRVCARGNLRSHIELQPLLNDALQQAFVEQDGLQPRISAKYSWQILLQRSPLAQREWADNWPEPSASDTLSRIQELKQRSRPLATIATIRAGISSSEAKKQTSAPSAWPNWSTNKRGFVIRAMSENGERRLRTYPLPSPASGGSPVTAADPDSFTITVSDDSLTAPLRSYIESDIVRDWLDQKAVRRNQKWILQEQDLRILPVPNHLLSRIIPDAGDVASGFATPLPGKWEKLAAELPVSPQNVRQSLQALDTDTNGNEVRCELFVRASRILQDVRTSRARIECWVKESGQIIWRELISTFPASDFVAVSVHPGVTLHGQLPLHTPIINQSLAKAPQSILLSTEAGHHLSLVIPNRLLLEILWDQIQILSKPTWSEIIEVVKAPRRLDSIEIRAADLLRVQGEQQMLTQHLEAILTETGSALLK
ncbi:MAG: hypothetical protein KGQ59_03020 [Bdellovibrionales bacterium]|nr:hypothetical protein [Bdellovibrionales bacterium]